jgi:hypothetical protein
MFIENESLTSTKIGLRQRGTLAKWLSIWGRRTSSLQSTTIERDTANV